MRVGAARARVAALRAGPLAPNEDAVHQFVTVIGTGYRTGSLPV